VSRDELIDGLWGERPPATAAKSIQIYVSQLRKALGSDVLVTRPTGYALELDSHLLDLQRFQRLVDDGKAALAAGRPADAAAKLREALSLWRGAPLADFSYEPFAQAEIARLEDLHLDALEERIDADLALGRHGDLTGELEAMVAKHPLRERLRGQLMLALYRSGRQAEALAVYQETRRLLVDDLGLEPSRELQELEQAILRHDDALAAPPRAVAPQAAAPLPRPRALLLAGGLILAAAVAAGVVELLNGSSAGGGLPRVAPDSLGAIDPRTNEIVAQVPVGAEPGHVLYAHGALWVANELDATIALIDPKTRRQTRVITLTAKPNGLAADSNAIWVTTDKGIEVIDPIYKQVTRTLPILGTKPSKGYPFASAPTNVTFALGSAWVTTSTGGLNGTLERVGPTSGSVVDAINVGTSPGAMASIGRGLWVADQFGNKVSRVDATGAVTNRIPVGRAPVDVAAGFGAIWVADADDDEVKRIDPQRGTIATTIPVGAHPAAIAVGAGAVWAANQYDGTISRIDPRRNEVVKTIDVGGSPTGIALSRALVWVTVQENPLAPVSKDVTGGVLRIAGRPNFDPAQAGLDFDGLQMLYTACARLLNYPDKSGPAGSRLQPEVARAMPDLSADRKTYTFRLRRDYRFSPPSNEPVTAVTFKDTIERTLNPKAKSPARLYGYLDDIVGAVAYERGKARHIAGLVARGNTLTVKLLRPAGDFPARVAMPFFCAVPLKTPIDPKGVPIPSAGPYYVASATKQQLILKRNPNYTGPRPRRTSEIVYSRTGSDERGVERVLQGDVDYAPVWNRYASALDRRFGSGAKPGQRQFFVHPIWAVDGFVLNAGRPLFADVKLRRAVSYAIDRRALSREGGFFLGEGGPLSSVPTDQYMPIPLAGYKDVSVYPLTPDVPQARRLAGRIHRDAVLVTCDFAPCPQEAQILRRDLAAIGITLAIKQFDTVGHWAKQPWDLALTTWSVDYPDPYDVVNVLLAKSGPFDLAHFHDRGYTRKFKAAAVLSGDARYRAYARLDADLARNAVPIVAFGNETQREFFSARVGCQLFQPVVGMDLGALCIKG
jgi:YVTN family beta-propeller protein